METSKCCWGRYTKPKKIKHKRKKVQSTRVEMTGNRSNFHQFPMLSRKSISIKYCAVFWAIYLGGHLEQHIQQRQQVKLAVLKFYKVDSNDKVTRLRRECPNETCGSGAQTCQSHVVATYVQRQHTRHISICSYVRVYCTYTYIHIYIYIFISTVLL